MEDELLEKIRVVLKQAEEIANFADEKYRVEAFVKTYEFLLGLLKLKCVPTIAESAEKVIIPEMPLKELSLPEFVSKANPRSNPERMVVIAYYITFIEGKKEFTFEDVMERWKKAALKMPANPRRDFRVAIRRGWISHANGTYYLTKSGKEFVESLLKGKEKKG